MKHSKFWMWIVWHLPKAVVYWAAIRLIAYATGEKYGSTVVPDLTCIEALKRFSKDNWGWT